MNRNEKLKQIDALRQVQRLLGFEDDVEMAKALNVSKSTLSRAFNPEWDKPLSNEHRLELAKLLGNHCHNLHDLAQLEQQTGWVLTPEERKVARAHFLGLEQLNFHGVPVFDPQRYVSWEAKLAEVQTAIVTMLDEGQQVLVIHGTPGVGKTTLALRVIYESTTRESFPGGIFWIAMEGQPETYIWLKLADFLIPETHWDVSADAATWERLKSQVIKRLPKKQRFLIVLDDVESYLSWDTWLAIPGLHLLVTTQLAHWTIYDQSGKVQEYPLDVLPQEISRTLLIQKTPVNVPEDVIEQLLIRLEGLPLALSIVNALAQQDRGFHTLAKEIGRDHVIPYLDLKKDVGGLAQPHKTSSLQWAFDMSYRRLPATDASVFRFLGLVAQPFQVELVAQISGYSEVGAALRVLVSHGLLELEQAGSYRMHRLLHEYAEILLEREDKEHLPVWQERFAGYMLDLGNDILTMWESGQERAALIRWSEEFEAFKRGYAYAARLKNAEWLTAYWHRLWIYLGVTAQSEQVVRMLQPFNGGVLDPELQTIVAGYAGEIYLMMGQSAAAIPFLQRCQASLWERQQLHLWLLATIRLGQAFIETGQFSQAWTVLHARAQAYQQTLAALPITDPLLVEAWGFFGAVHQVSGDHVGALYGYRKALEMQRAQLQAPQYWPAARTLLSIGENEAAINRWAAAAQTFAEGMSVADTGGYDFLWAMHASQRVLALLQLGESATARTLLGEVEERSGGDPRLKPLLCLARGELAWEQGDIAAGETAYRQAIESTQGTTLEVDLWWRLAKHRQMCHDEGGMIAAWQTIRERTYQTGNYFRYLQATLAYGRHLVEQGSTTEGQRLLEEVESLATQRGYVAFAAEAAEALGMQDIAEQFREKARAQIMPLLLALEIEPINGVNLDSIFIEDASGAWQLLTEKLPSTPALVNPQNFWGTPTPDSE